MNCFEIESSFSLLNCPVRAGAPAAVGCSVCVRERECECAWNQGTECTGGEEMRRGGEGENLILYKR